MRAVLVGFRPKDRTAVVCRDFHARPRTRRVVYPKDITPYVMINYRIEIVPTIIDCVLSTFDNNNYFFNNNYYLFFRL